MPRKYCFQEMLPGEVSNLAVLYVKYGPEERIYV